MACCVCLRHLAPLPLPPHSNCERMHGKLLLLKLPGDNELPSCLPASDSFIWTAGPKDSASIRLGLFRSLPSQTRDFESNLQHILCFSLRGCGLWLQEERHSAGKLSRTQGLEKWQRRQNGAGATAGTALLRTLLRGIRIHLVDTWYKCI